VIDMDALTLLKNDHKTIEDLFKKFEKAGDRAYVQKRQIAERVIEELSVHAAIEEQLLYPVIRATIPDADDDALEALEEHHVMKWLLYEIERTPAEDERYDAKMAVLMDVVRHHVEEEESDLFPQVREELGRKILGELGEEMELARQIAPTHPHPRSPDAPPGNLVMGAAAGVADRIGDTVSGIAQGSMTAAGDIIDRVLRRDKRRAAPKGSSVATSTARRVRSGASDATDSAVDSAKSAVRKGQSVMDAAEATASRNIDTALAQVETNQSGTPSRTASKARKATNRRKSGAKSAAKSGPKSSAKKSAPKSKTASGNGRRPAKKSAAKRASKRASSAQSS
jgi:hemerythrin superfamily protein